MSLDDEDDGVRSARVIAMLADKFPQSFFVALGDGIDEFQLSAALAMYCRAVGYLRRCKEGAPRIDLSGEPVGEVSAEEAKFAKGRRCWIEDSSARRR